MLGNHFGEQPRRASGNNPDNPSSFVPYHHRLSIRPAKIPDQGLSLRLRHVWKSWGAEPGNKVAVPRGRRIIASRSSRVVFFPQRHCPWRDHYALALFSPAVAVQTLILTGKMSRIIVIFDIFWTMGSLFLKTTRVKFNWLLSRQHVHLKKKGF